MINNYLTSLISSNFGFPPTEEQSRAINLLAEFVSDAKNDIAFILRGYAGTGKTTLIGALVKAMDGLGLKVVLLAPTGRAAKVFSGYSGHAAFTIHKKIYRQRAFSNENDNFGVNDNLATNTLFIVDEASMISNQGLSGALFGTGRLLDDLVQFVYSGNGCRLLLLGDTAQLPPVGEEVGEALTTGCLEAYGLAVRNFNMTQVVRQQKDSGILRNATMLRRLTDSDELSTMPKLHLSGYNDISALNGAELTETLEGCYGKDGMEETIVLCRSNKRANQYNHGIRNSILYREEELCAGDLLMVAKNNYYWTQKVKEIDFIANGDIAVVKRVRRVKELYGFRFAEVTVSFPDYEEVELEVVLLLDTLRSDTPALPKIDNDRLFYTILEDYADVASHREKMKKMKSDPYYNALQVKYAYAITCHKAQGGQWRNVFLDQAYISDEYLNTDALRWLYTAFTRATKHLYLVNYPTAHTE